MKRARLEMENGILAKYRVLRARQLEQLVAENCYTSKKFTFDEAGQCATFHLENDYKMNQIDTFWKDHIPKHAQAYSSCLTKTGLDALDTVAAKDKAFAQCHEEWVMDFKQN